MFSEAAMFQHLLVSVLHYQFYKNLSLVKYKSDIFRYIITYILCDFLRKASFSINFQNLL